jgi:hypothetical protein
MELKQLNWTLIFLEIHFQSYIYNYYSKLQPLLNHLYLDLLFCLFYSQECSDPKQIKIFYYFLSQIYVLRILLFEESGKKSWQTLFKNYLIGIIIDT